MSGETKLPPGDPFSDVEVLIWTCISCLTGHDESEVYQSINIAVSIGDLDQPPCCGIPNALLCLACFVCSCLR